MGVHSALGPSVHRARPARGPLGLLAMVLLAMLTAQIGVATAYAGTSAPARANGAASVQSPSQLKVVIIVGPTDTLTDKNLTDAESLAQAAESYGMDVHRIFYPNATWDGVVAVAQGANLLVYMGHGNGWPSPYAPFQEDTKNGIGVGPFANGSKSQTKYYGANVVRTDIKLAPNAIVFLNHLCYAAGNGETGMAVPNWDIAHQRNDNFAAGFLAAGARTVFAYSWQLYIKSLRDLMTTDKTMKDIFETPGAQPKAYYGWIGADARMFDSVRTPGTVNYLDRDPKDGFLRGVSGDLSMTAGQWRGEESTANLKDMVIPPVGPTIPQAFHATAYNNRVVQLSWQPATAAQYGDMRYVVARNNKSLGSWTTGTTFTDQPSKAGTYTYQVRAIDPAGNKGLPSVTLTITAADQVGATPPPTPTPTPTPTSTPAPTPTPTPSTTPTPTPTPTPSTSPTPTPTPASTPPTTPRNFGAVLGDANQVTLSWSASTAYVAGTVNYRVFRNGTALGVKSPSLTYVDQPTPGASYTYKVRAIDSTGVTSAYSASITVEVPGTTVTADTTPPSRPTGLTAVSLTSRQISLSWLPSTDDRPGTLSYRVFRDSTLITTVTDPWFIDAPGSAGTYSYKVKAVDAAGNKSSFSAAVKGYAFD